MSDFSANIKALLDLRGIGGQIKAIESTQIVLSNITVDINAIKSSISKAIKGANFSVNLGLGGTGRQIQDITKIEASIARVKQQYQSLNNTVSGLGKVSDSSDMYKRLENVSSSLKELDALQTKMASNNISDTDFAANYVRYNEVLEQVKNNLSIVTSSTKQFTSAIKVAGLQNSLDTFLTKNPRAAKEYGDRIHYLANELRKLSAQGAVSTTDFQRILNDLRQIDMSVEVAGKKGKSFFGSFSSAFQSISKYVSASTVIYKSIETLRQGVKDVIDLDTALVDLQKTTKASSTQLNDFYFASNDIAKSLGVTTKQVISSAADWSRLGFSIQDAQEMAKTSSIFASISPGMDITKATDTLVSVMKAFDIEAPDALDGIASKINAIGNSQALSNGDIAEFLTRSSSAMKEANNSLEETIALGTAATEVTRDAASVGNVLKTTSMRLRGYSEETESYSEDVEMLSGKIADLTKTASKPGGISLFRDANKTEFKSTYEILRDIADIYPELTDAQQAPLLEALAGKRNGQAIAAILNNWKAVEDSLAIMTTSAGNAMKEMDVIEESIAFKLNALQETGTGIFQNLFQREDIGIAIDGLTSILNVLDSLTEKLGLFKTIGAAGGIAVLGKSLA